MLRSTHSSRFPRFVSCFTQFARRGRTRFFAVLCVLCVLCGAAPAAAAPGDPPSVEASIQGFLDAQPGPLKSYRDGDKRAAEIIQATSSYYGVSSRILLALLEATGGLLSTPSVPDQALQQPFGSAGPSGFAAQLDWAGREVRAGYGPYERPPTVRFTDGTTLTLTLDQAPEGVAVQRFLAKNRAQAEWLAAFGRFTLAFQTYFDNTLPADRAPQPSATSGFLRRPWPEGTNVVHLAYFDHMFPTVDADEHDNGFVVNYLGRGGMQYDGHDGHDFYFPDQPIGTYILAAADGVAFARTHRGNGVVIVHPGGYETVYWHLDKFSKRFKGLVDTDQGVPVKAGDVLGSSGKTGFTTGTPHLHFEVRHNGKQVDPYGWYGSGTDPCAAYPACEPSVWLWQAELANEFDFAPPNAPAAPDQTPPVASIVAAPPADLLLHVRPEEALLQQVGRGLPSGDGASRLAYPVLGNLSLEAGTIALSVELPETYPATSTGRNYLLASSAHPDEAPVYTDTLALRRELGRDGEPRWNFWTTPESGDAGRNDLVVQDTLAPGLHRFAITWNREARTKALFIDGHFAAAVFGVEVPLQVGELLDIGRFSPGHGASGVRVHELAIYNRALSIAEVERLALDELPSAVTHVPEVWVDANAADDAGGIVSVQLGVNGVFGDPQPYEDSYHVPLPAATGTYTVSARFFDRAGNSITADSRVTYTPPDVYLPMTFGKSESGIQNLE